MTTQLLNKTTFKNKDTNYKIDVENVIQTRMFFIVRGIGAIWEGDRVCTHTTLQLLSIIGLKYSIFEIS